MLEFAFLCFIGIKIQFEHSQIRELCLVDQQVSSIWYKDFSEPNHGLAMSLFENDQYEYTDTFFVFFKRENLPAPEAITSAFSELGPRYEPGKISLREEAFESMTVLSPQDFSAMDIVLDLNAEIATQIEEMVGEFRTLTLTGDEREKLTTFKSCNARFDLFHFEKKVAGNEDPDAFIDPGGLLIVLERLRALCGGVGIDPQSQMLL